MPILLSQKTMTWILTALLLVNGIGTHGFHHAHARGEESHSHASKGVEAPKHAAPGHSHCDHHRGEQSHGNVCDLAAGAILHTHISLFGIDLSIPHSDDSRDDDEENHSSVFVRTHDNCANLLVARSLDIDHLRTLALIATCRDAVGNPVAALTLPQVLSTPLCDSARFERSGVLLI